MKYIIHFSIILVTSCVSAPDPKKWKAELHQAFIQNEETIQQCYVDSIKENKNKKALFGTLMLEFSLNDQGQVQNQKIDQKRTSIQNPKLEQCLLAHLPTWKFPKAPHTETSEVKYPLAFSPD